MKTGMGYVFSHSMRAFISGNTVTDRSIMPSIVATNYQSVPGSSRERADCVSRDGAREISFR
ncbi:MAG: hypothetical protein P8182_18005 [Deltaproteobacteria bacterium]